MREIVSEFGHVLVGNREELFAQAVVMAEESLQQSSSRHFTWALTGGSTPQAWYRWCAEKRVLSSKLTQEAHFTVSDERHVVLSSDQSNFGNAERGLLSPLEVPTDHRHPWVVAWPPMEAAEAYRKTMLILAGPGRGYDLCFLGMGDDCHTASLFPGTPLLKDDGGLLWGAQEVPGKGWRLTITPTGLKACARIVVMTLGPDKAAALARIHRGDYSPVEVPSQILKASAARVTWLVDEAAASRL